MSERKKMQSIWKEISKREVLPFLKFQTKVSQLNCQQIIWNSNATLYPCIQEGREGKGGGVYMRQVKIIVEKYPDGYVAYPLGLKGVVVGQGDTYEEALSDVKSAIRFHMETFGKEVLEAELPILEAFVAETGVEI
jgi:predicted RNase H-like HicB family nuclease